MVNNEASCNDMKTGMVSATGSSFLESVEVASSTVSSIHVSWRSENVPQIQAFQVHIQEVASTYIRYSDMLPPTITQYNIDDLVADTYYKVCVAMYRNDTTSPIRECIDASTNNWQIPVSIGSSIGAILALSIIVLIVLIAQCPAILRRRRKRAKAEAALYNSMGSNQARDEHLEMSDTTMHGHDDDIYSDHDMDSQADITSPLNESRASRYSGEQTCNGSKKSGGQYNHKELEPSDGAHFNRSRNSSPPIRGTVIKLQTMGASQEYSV